MAPQLNPRETFDRQIQDLMDEILVLGSMVENATLDAVDALKRRDLEAAKRVYLADERVKGEVEIPHIPSQVLVQHAVEMDLAVRRDCVDQTGYIQPMVAQRGVGSVLRLVQEMGVFYV